MKITSLMAYLRTLMHIPVRQIQAYLATLHGLKISSGEIVEVLRRLKAKLEPTLAGLKDDQLEALIDWDDPVVTHGLAHRVKYARLLRRRASSPRAQGADSQGERYFVQLALEGVPLQKPEHAVGSCTVGLDLGPASIAIVPREAEARLEPLCAELRPDARAIRRLQRRMDRQRRDAPGPRTGGTLHEVPTRSTKLSQFCHGCGQTVKKPLWQRWQKSRLWHRAGAARPVFRISSSLS